MGEGTWVGLAEAVRSVRAELAEAMADGQDERLRFEVGPIEMEFKVEVRREGKAEGKVKVWVVEAGASGGMSHGSSHMLKVVLNPVDTDTGKEPVIRQELSGRPPRPDR